MKDFIISLFNLVSNQISSFVSSLNDDGSLEAFINTVPLETDCPYCHGPLISNGHGRTKTINHNALSDRHLTIHWKPKRFKCKDCGKTITERNPFTFPGFSNSYTTIRQIMLDLRKPNMTYKDIAERNQVSPTQVQRYFDSYIISPRPYLPENMGIDEIHSSMAKYGSAYLLVIVDNVKRCLVDILPSRSKHELKKYFESFPKEERDKVRYITIDMWQPYEDVVKQYCKNCEVAVDPFHVTEHLVSALTRIRLNIMNQVEYGSPSYYLLKKWNWLLTTSDVDLDNDKQMNHVFNRYLNRRDILEMLLSLDENLALGYHLKENFSGFIKECSPENAAEEMKLMLEAFSKADIPEYSEFTSMIHNWSDEIINSFNRPYDNRKQSNALAESINSKIRTYLSVSRGNTNFERFRRRMLYCFNDSVFYSTTTILKSLKSDGRLRGPYNKNK